ncbi:hypothetical protein V8G54_006334 [Vigna mungo]|uniref:Uncharacterized protein n=1 Tax=Vigna mungo TaxID=3915 RepID=A0AAQ3P203_VIGMU
MANSTWCRDPPSMDEMQSKLASSRQHCIMCSPCLGGWIVGVIMEADEISCRKDARGLKSVCYWVPIIAYQLAFESLSLLPTQIQFLRGSSILIYLLTHRNAAVVAAANGCRRACELMVVVEKENETVVGVKKEEDLEKGEVDVEEERKVQSNDVVDDQSYDHEESHLAGFHRLNLTNPLRIVINSSTRAVTPSAAQSQRPHTHMRSTPTPL